MITNDELKTHFGGGWEYEHAVNLRDRMPENANHLQASLAWASEEAKKVGYIIPWLKSGAEGVKGGDVAHFERTLEILRELVG
jgi:hypothetical protein